MTIPQEVMAAVYLAKARCPTSWRSSTRNWPAGDSDRHKRWRESWGCRGCLVPGLAVGEAAQLGNRPRFRSDRECSNNAAVTETFRDSTAGFMGIETVTSDKRSAQSDSPTVSAPRM